MLQLSAANVAGDTRAVVNQDAWCYFSTLVQISSPCVPPPGRGFSGPPRARDTSTGGATLEDLRDRRPKGEGKAERISGGSSERGESFGPHLLPHPEGGSLGSRERATPPLEAPTSGAWRNPCPGRSRSGSNDSAAAAATQISDDSTLLTLGPLGPPTPSQGRAFPPQWFLLIGRPGGPTTASGSRERRKSSSSICSSL